MPGRRPRRRALPAHASTTATGSATPGSPGARSWSSAAGWIGLEAAAAARGAGARGHRARERRAAAAAGARPRGRGRSSPSLHREHGVDLRLGAGHVRELARTRAVPSVTLADGTRARRPTRSSSASASAPNTELAEAAGLTSTTASLVDAHLRTSDPDIFAAGDVANAYHPLLGRHLRVEHWANALQQPAPSPRGRCSARTPCLRPAAVLLHRPVRPGHGVRRLRRARRLRPGRLPRRPWPAREFIAFWLRDGRVLAGMNVNVWDVQDDIQALVRAGSRAPGRPRPARRPRRGVGRPR